MRKSILSIFFFLSAAWFMAGNVVHAANASDGQGDEFEQLMSKIRQDFVHNPQDTTIENALKHFNAEEGSFSDVDYASIQRTNWPPIVHVDRLSEMVFAYTTPENKLFGSEDLYAKIVKALSFWQKRNPWCHNWWYNQIAEPQKLGVLLIQMRTGKKQIPSDLEAEVLQRIKTDGGNPAKWTGANRTDIALHWIYRACLTKDEGVLRTALENVYSPIVYTVDEGFQYDNSYFQHGRQLYIGGYGDEILKGITQVAMYTKGTRYALPQDKLDIVSKFMRGTYYATMRGKYMMFDVMGRGISRPGITDKSYTKLFAQRMAELDTAHASEFRDIIARLEETEPAGYAIQPKHTHYFRGDYTLHVRPNYTFDVRTVSNRTLRVEYGNGENLKTYFMSDGCTNIVTRGDEYVGIFPVWDWAHIPGVTSPHMHEIPKAKIDWQTPGTSTFTGGVSDSLYGVTAYAYTDTFANVNTGAKKAWFFFDNEVVCLGADITSTASDEVFTTINQCLSGSEKQILRSAVKSSPLAGGGTAESTSPQWVIHDGVAYLFPNGGKVQAVRKEQSGSYYDINHSTPKDVHTHSVFTLSLSHGLKPQAKSYAYIVAPGIDTEKAVKQYQKKSGVEICANTPRMQVVRNKNLGVWGLVFYSAGEFQHKGLRIAVDRPCTLLLKETGKHTASLHVADPAQAQQEISVSVSRGRGTQSQAVRADFRGTGVYAGATKQYTLAF